MAADIRQCVNCLGHKTVKAFGRTDAGDLNKLCADCVDSITREHMRRVGRPTEVPPPPAEVEAPLPLHIMELVQAMPYLLGASIAQLLQYAESRDPSLLQEVGEYVRLQAELSE